MARYVISLEGEMAGEIHWGNPGAVELEGCVYTQEYWEMCDESRWDNIFEFVIKRRDSIGNTTYWQAFIRRGKTESQDSCDFRDESFIEFEQVDKIPTVTYKYEVIQ